MNADKTLQPRIDTCRFPRFALLGGVVLALLGAPSMRAGTDLTIRESRFLINGEPTFLLGLSYYGGLGAAPETLPLDLDDAQRHGFNWVRVWATWAAFDHDVSAVDSEGRAREPYLDRLKQIVAECDRRGLVVDVTLSRGNGISGPERLQSLEAQRRAVECLVGTLAPWRNWYLDLSNERNIQDSRFTSFEELRAVRARARELDPTRLVTASHAGDMSREELREYLSTVGVDFLSPHRPRHAQSPGQTADKTRELLAWSRELGRVVPVHQQEPFRRGFNARWEPEAGAFFIDLAGAKDGGAAGWCFHNGDQRAAADGRPRRSFDLRDGRLFEQLDAVERDVVAGIREGFSGVVRGDDKTDPWRRIVWCFQPPAAFAGALGPYRSPLLFLDGTRVTNAADWARRRAEILREWDELMGPWPAVIEQPRLEIVDEERRDSIVWRRVRVETAPGQTGDGWLLVPGEAKARPAVLVVYYEPETSAGLNPKQPLRDFGLQLARRGFVTLSIGTPGGDARLPEQGQARCQPLSFHAYVAANCWHVLANLPEVDRDRIGVVGHSYGGKWALFAAALWDKFACVAVSDPGIVFDESRPNVNYWEPWYLGFDPEHPRPKAGVPSTDNPRTGGYAKMIEEGRDLHELHALVAPRPLFVSGGSEDPPSRWIALNHAVEVNRLLGFTHRVGMSNRAGHDPTEESNGQIYDFFEHFLKVAQAVR